MTCDAEIESNRPKLWNRNYLRTWGANFTLFFSFMLIVPLLPIYLQEQFGASKEMIGVVLSGYTVVAMLTRATSGYVVDKYPRKQVLVLGFVLLFAFYFGYLLASSLLLFAVVRTLHGLPFGIATVANSTVAIDVLPAERRAEGIGYYGLSNNVATAISPTVGLWIYETWHDFDLLFCCSLAVAAVGVAAVAGLDALGGRTERRPMESAAAGTANEDEGCGGGPMESAAAGTTNEDESDGARQTTAAIVRWLERFYLAQGWAQGVAIACFSFAYGVVSTYVAIYGREELGITGGSGVFFALLASGLIVSRLFGSRSLRRGRILHNATLGTCLSCVGYLLFAALHNEVGYYGCAILVGLGNGHLWPAFQSMFISLASASKRGVANASLLTSWDLGVGLGVVSGGSLIEHFGYHSAFWGGWLVETLGVVFYLLYVRRKYPRQLSAMLAIASPKPTSQEEK